MTDFCSLVNVFHGSDKMRLRKPYGVAKKWYFIKGLCGNTTPAATLPFGKLECGCYTGGYTSGYTNNEQNAGVGRPSVYGWNIFSEKSFSVPKLHEKLSSYGFAHMQQSGTGLCGTYYNYAVTTPFYGELENVFRPVAIEKEDGRPGYYSHTREDGIFCEATVSEKCATHRYRFPKEGGRLAINFAANGLMGARRDLLYGDALDGRVTVLSDNEVAAEVTLYGVRMYFRVTVIGASAVSLFKSREIADGDTVLFDFPKGTEAELHNAGCVFECENDVTVKVSLSSKSAEAAEAFLAKETRSFEELKTDAYATWNKYLSVIEIDADERTKRIFYSNFYHSIVKPTNWAGESYYSDEEDFFCDFVTLWDTYKTQSPLMFTLYPDIASRIIRFFCNFCEANGYFPHDLYMRKGSGAGTDQACMIAEYLICDAYYRGVPNIDWERVFANVETNLKRPHIVKFMETGETHCAPHILDMADAFGNLTTVAKELGYREFYDKYAKHADKWKDAYDPETGLMTLKSEYYEGTRWSYSFRQMIHMDERIALCGSRENFIHYMDQFFGFTPCEDPDVHFQGYNNESDMESPYSYVLAGEHDKLCDIVNGATKYMFTEGRGALPGNNDSGGLSAAYMWNVMGIFPVTGQNLMLVGCPQVDRAVIHLASGKDLTVVKHGSGSYVASASLNGKVLDDFRFTVREMMEGGTLDVTMR